MNWNQDPSNNLAAAAERLQYEKQAQAAQQQAGSCVQAQAIGRDTEHRRPRPSLREEAEKTVGHYRDLADKADRSAAFFREHPEFDEFIQLIRAGVIGI